MNSPLDRQAVFDLLQEKMQAIMERPPQRTPEETMSMVDDLDADSLEATQIIAETTKQLGVRLSRDDIKGLKTIGDLLDAIMSKTAAGR